MAALIPDGPLLWYVNRTSGVVLLALLTLSVLLGIGATRGSAGTRVPRFVVQALHRNTGLLALTMLAVHIASAVLDEYVDIRWWHAVAPWGLRYEPLWLALGVVAGDLFLAAAVSSMVRTRMPLGGWTWLHRGTYLAWALAMVHGIAIGTDTGAPWAAWVYAAGGSAVASALLLRIVGGRWRGRAPTPARPGTLPVESGRRP